jgi:four helix bundle protein
MFTRDFGHVADEMRRSDQKVNAYPQTYRPTDPTSKIVVMNWRFVTMPRDYRKIVAWQRSHDLTLAVYNHTRRFPDDERFGLTSQLRRASFSVPSNISEGSGRDSNKDYLRFLFISLASLKETEYFLLLARDLGYLPDEAYDQLTEKVNATFGALQGLIKVVKKEVGSFGRLHIFLTTTVLMALGKLYT